MNVRADRRIVDAKGDESLRHDRQTLVATDAYPVLVVGNRAQLVAEFAVARETIAVDQAAAGGANEVEIPIVEDRIAEFIDAGVRRRQTRVERHRTLVEPAPGRVDVRRDGVVV